jgi:hypothetical protein
LKVKQSVFGVTTIEVKIRPGQFSILTKQRDHKLRVSTKTLVFTSTDHSTLSQNSHSTELLSATVPTTFGLEDGDTMLEPSNGSSMVLPRPSGTTTGSHTHLTSKATAEAQM